MVAVPSVPQRLGATGPGPGSGRLYLAGRLGLLLPGVLPAQPAPNHWREALLLRIVAARRSVLESCFMSSGGRIPVRVAGTLGTPSSSGRQFANFGPVANA